VTGSVAGMESNVVRRRPFGRNPLVGEKGMDTRRRILAAALDVFGEESYAETRVEQIADRAGCSRPALYQYFSSKEDVFWALATELGARMVAHADSLGPVTPDDEGVERLRDWVRDFMELHEQWAPVFHAFPSASRGAASQAGGSGAISSRTGRALLEAFGVPRDDAAKRLARVLVMVLIRCSFYAEAAPAGLSHEPLVKGLALLVHRTLAGPIEGVNVVRRATRPKAVEVVAPVEVEPLEELGPRAERTRRKLLEAGATVLPSRGYHDTRVDDIAEAAGVSHGTFYRYFDSKDDFFRALATIASARLVELLDRLRFDGSREELRAWMTEWFATYEADGGVISTWQDMRTSPELREFSQAIAVDCFTRLEALLAKRDFGQDQVDASMLLALVERAPYGVFTLGFMSRSQAIEASVTIVRRGFLGLED